MKTFIGRIYVATNIDAAWAVCGASFTIHCLTPPNTSREPQAVFTIHCLTPSRDCFDTKP
jgi:hypothetical protein